MAESMPSSVSKPSASATRVSREIFGLKFLRIPSRQLAIAVYAPPSDRVHLSVKVQPVRSVPAEAPAGFAPACVVRQPGQVPPRPTVSVDVAALRASQADRGLPGEPGTR